MLLYRESQHTLDFTVLSERAEITKATLTGLIDGLDSQGLVERIPYPKDRRKQLLRLTANGLTLLERMLPSHYRTTAHFMSGLNTSQQLELTGLLNRLHEMLVDIASLMSEVGTMERPTKPLPDSCIRSLSQRNALELPGFTMSVIIHPGTLLAAVVFIF